MRLKHEHYYVFRFFIVSVRTNSLPVQLPLSPRDSYRLLNVDQRLSGELFRLDSGIQSKWQMDRGTSLTKVKIKGRAPSWNLRWTRVHQFHRPLAVLTTIILATISPYPGARRPGPGTIKLWKILPGLSYLLLMLSLPERRTNRIIHAHGRLVLIHWQPQPSHHSNWTIMIIISDSARISVKVACTAGRFNNNDYYQWQCRHFSEVWVHLRRAGQFNFSNEYLVGCVSCYPFTSTILLLLYVHRDQKDCYVGMVSPGQPPRRLW